MSGAQLRAQVERSNNLTQQLDLAIEQRDYAYRQFLNTRRELLLAQEEITQLQLKLEAQIQDPTRGVENCYYVDEGSSV